jgi:hypothetical protein
MDPQILHPHNTPIWSFFDTANGRGSLIFQGDNFSYIHPSLLSFYLSLSTSISSRSTSESCIMVAAFVKYNIYGNF